MKQYLVISILLLCGLSMVAESLLNFTAEYKGEKYWNCREMVPYDGCVRVEFKDSCAFVTNMNSERIDTFKYDKPFRYIRKSGSIPIYERLILTEDSLSLQIGMPSEQNYFYRLENLLEASLCQECVGIGRKPCPYCQGVGRKGHDLCPFCKGKRSMSNALCRRCNGKGVIMNKVQNMHRTK